MKIALYNLTTTTRHGGVETRNREIAKVLARHGHDVHLFGGDDGRTHHLEGVPIRLYPFTDRERFPNFGTRFRKFMERLTFGRHAWKDLADGGYDIIYLVKPFDMPFAFKARKKSGARVVFASGGTEFFLGYKYLAKRLDLFFSCSRSNADQIEDYCGLRPIVLPNGVNIDTFRPLAADPELARSLGIGPKDKVIFSACRLVGLKGIDYALKALAGLVEQGMAVKYLITGDGPVQKNLEALTLELGLEDRVIFTGGRSNDELPQYYALADIAVYPSVGAETFGIAMGEALACGVPVVSTNVGGIPDVVTEGTGLLVAPKNADALAAAMTELLTRDDLRTAMGRAGHKWISENLSWEASVVKLESYLNGL